MKKYLLIGMVAGLFMAMPSCTYNTYTEPSTGTGTTCKFHAFTRELNVAAGDWQWDNGARMYFAHFDVADLTNEVFQYGVITVSHEYAAEKPYLVVLPETMYKEVSIDNGDGTSSPYYFQQHIDYAVGVGFVEIFITISDYYYEDFTPEAMKFRLQAVY